MELQELVSTPTLSRLLDVKERTIRGWVTKRIVPYRKLGKLVRFNVQEVRQWCEAGRVAPLTNDPIRDRMA